ncbi:RNA polymerase sigma factor (sigma-70 family) [Aquimarina sp. EL_43]|uniref:RNA polymerase sigma factor n=1 Tax=Aquimarina TaxID=290174 RepID=UPI0004711198|nr:MULTISPECIES: sigma-70 family RNA polymerase sigma factor [Aquimarina]MBG6130085.1 RNA polymerase sigma factor (sigma-70 family) [Aquimarina sp. EL_35]MBG6148865.1 RNA polymerase sigma factor (sigma-70 family) [Aquimarina sp. EL_32]MBG6168761.1 RNA polymerase sigma factor (sigma-70 family) [Aquimarina sp. EL_43]
MQSVKTKDTTLWTKVKLGDLDAFNQLYDKYIDALYEFGIQYTNDTDYVKDCIHDLFLDIYKYRKKLSDVDNVKYYLFKSLKRKINRKFKSKLTLFSTEEKKNEIKSEYKSIEETIIQSENSSEIEAKLSVALTSLSSRQRKGLSLKFEEKKSYEEIAAIMGISIESVRTLIYRAVKKLRNKI